VLGKTRRIHFVGIGGSGMSGIAELLVNLGYVVSGSDERESTATTRLASLGVKVSIGHDEAHAVEADVVVMSSAVRRSNPEVAAAQARGIPVIPRAEMLAELMRLRYAIAVAGAHGKTTTTSMIAVVLERAGLDPTAVIGGKLSAFGSNARLGQGERMVAEADESDRSFLKLFPTIAVITNIDHEHLESYRSFGDLQQAFVEFANKVPFYGAVVCCVDNPHVAAIVPRMARRVRTYGLENPDADITATDVELGPFSVSAVVQRRIPASTGSDSDELPRTQVLGPLTLSVPGRHNLANALAAVAVGLELDVPFDRLAAGLAGFRGAERRFEVKGEVNGVLVVDDYGHHPTEIAAVLAAARTLDRRVVVVFQPHRYTRTAALMTEFADALAAADLVVLTDIYSAGEEPVDGVTLEQLALHVRRALPQRVEEVPLLKDVPGVVARIVQPGDVVITLGAGSIATVPDEVLALLAQNASADPANRGGKTQARDARRRGRSSEGNGA
jgi:UDP-N-acetylmuramate--alanine ligase